jgi:hypothetical protein
MESTLALHGVCRVNIPCVSPRRKAMTVGNDVPWNHHHIDLADDISKNSPSENSDG